MRAAAILGLGCSRNDLKPFQADTSVEWIIGMPTSPDEVGAILLFGGDGTIHRHLGQLVKLGLPVLVVPAGSGNDFASSLGLRHVRDSLVAWRKFIAGGRNLRKVDLGIITTDEVSEEQTDESKIPTSAKTGQKWGIPPSNGTYFCCVAGVGLDGEVARRANRLPRWLRGNGGYLMSLLPAIFSFAAFPLKILIPSNDNDLDHWTIRSEQPTLLAAFANTPLYGGGMKVAPRAKMDDGLLDVCVVGAVNAVKLFTMFPTVYAGKHLGIREVEYFHAPRLRLETEQPLDVYADGEYVCRRPVEIGVASLALKVVVP